ncbi:MAG: hypothetical protein J5537_04255 [Lachnospiraceae bacterium]|nr:hypothetical protein [Lachnospiraceae bacterium]
MIISEEMKKQYIEDVHEEMKRRGFTSDEIPIVIGKTGFMSVMDKYPEEQLHYDVRDAVDEIMLTASVK